MLRLFFRICILRITQIQRADGMDPSRSCRSGYLCKFKKVSIIYDLLMLLVRKDQDMQEMHGDYNTEFSEHP